MNPNRIALGLSGVLLLAVLGVVLRGVSAPGVAPPTVLEELAVEAPKPRPPKRRAPPKGETDREKDGIRFGVLKEGTGEPSTPSDRVAVHLSSWLEDGPPLDDTRMLNRPVAFQLGAGKVYPGLDSLLTGMKAGERRKGVIPPEQAFGDKGRGAKIPPGATLIVVAEVLKITSPE